MSAPPGKRHRPKVWAHPGAAGGRNPVAADLSKGYKLDRRAARFSPATAGSCGGVIRMAKGEHVRVPLRIGAGVTAGVLLSACASSARAGQYFADFNDGNVGAALLFGSAGIDNGSLRLTQNLKS